MGVKIRKRAGIRGVFVDSNGRRKAKCVGASRQLAEQVRGQLEAKLKLGDMGFLEERPTIFFREYATRWMREHVKMHCKPSTARGYQNVLDLHVFPRFGSVRLDRLTREAIRTMFVELSETGLYQNTLNNALIVIRSLLNSAIEDGLISSNPAGKLGKFIPRDEDHFEVNPLTSDELETFLSAVLIVCPDHHPLFLTLARTGMRLGEVLALKWGDIQFGQGEEDHNQIHIRTPQLGRRAVWQAQKRQGAPR